MIFSLQDPRAGSAQKKNRLSYALIFGLITASTAAIVVCPCDRPGGSSYSIFLSMVSALFGAAAAFLIYLEMRHKAGTTAFLKAVGAIAIVTLGVYAEFTVAMNAISWLAQHSK